MNRALDGVKQSGKGMARAADEVRVASQATLNGEAGLLWTVSISGGLRHWKTG